LVGIEQTDVSLPQGASRIAEKNAANTSDPLECGVEIRNVDSEHRITDVARLPVGANRSDPWPFELEELELKEPLPGNETPDVELRFR
jgi:hypothetical protein